MSAAEVREALLGRWPVGEYLHVYEAPMRSDRSGRKLDVVVVSLWNSRGHALDGVEIKISMSDWKRELDEPDKADFWWHHVDRFWIAAPSDVAKKIKPQLPPTWGLLAINGAGCKVLVQPTRNEKRVALTWPETVGLLRATAGFGAMALQHRFQQGFEAGREAEVSAQSRGVPSDPIDARKLRTALQEVEQLRTTITIFEQASGLKLGNWTHDAERMGRIVKAVMAGIIQGPETLDQRLTRQVDQLRAIADTADRLRLALAGAFEAEAAAPSLFADSSAGGATA